jgi:hypothetical protein
MKTPALAAAFLGLIGALAVVPASADDLITYSNIGPASFKTDSWNFTTGEFAVTDSFTFATFADLNHMSISAWLFPGDVLTSVSWAITTAPFGGTVIASGTQADPSNGVFGHPFGVDLTAEKVDFNVALQAGTYWLLLYDGVTAENNPVFWDESAGHSSAFQTGTGAIPSETFILYGTTPEPSSLLLLGSGLLGFALMMRSKLKA